jgi:hypothetical protein
MSNAANTRPDAATTNPGTAGRGGKAACLTCSFCKSSNTWGMCGCGAARLARGEKPTPEVDINSIELFF